MRIARHCVDVPRVLALEEINLQIGADDDPSRQPLLDGVTLRMRRGELVGVVGPSGCGKSTLLKVIAGLLDPTEGAVFWDGRDLAVDGDLPPAELGYVPQFSLAHDRLTVRECVDYAARLRVAGFDPDLRRERVAKLLRTAGLEGLADRQSRVLSGGQRRRLSLAIEMVTSPSLLLCDEVTSGLDPGSAHKILTLLHILSRADGGGRRVVVNVTHSLADLHLYDRIIVLSAGIVAYDGPPQYLTDYFQAESAEEIFTRLAEISPEEWRDSWRENRPQLRELEPADAPHPEATPTDAATPDALTQLGIVFERRLRLFFRDRAQLGLQLGLILGFPCLVVIFALKGLPQIRNLSLENNLSIIEQLRESASYMMQAFDVGGLVSGLLLFQIILLALMGSNNSALEIAGERGLLESEKLAGLSAAGYLGAKCLFLAMLVTAQSVWMVCFVHGVCGFPGDLSGQIALLWLADGALTAICLAFSSMARTPSQASLLSIYFVGFQLPLSGAVLALPDAAAKLTRPFIAAYWSWSGAIQTLRETRFYDLILTTAKTDLSALQLCYWVLLAQVAISLLIAYMGCRRSAWD